MDIFNWKPLTRLLLVVAAFAAVEVANGESFNATLKKAEQGDADAQFQLGVMYAEGRGVLKSYVDAVKWYRKAAEQGDVHAQYNLGDP